MAKSKIIAVNTKISGRIVGVYKKIESAVVGSYKRIESGVVDGYTKIEDAFVDRFLTRPGETVTYAKKRLRQQIKKDTENDVTPKS